MAQQTTTELARTLNTDAADSLQNRLARLAAQGDLVLERHAYEQDGYEALLAGDTYVTPGGEVVTLEAVHTGSSPEDTEVTVAYHHRGREYEYTTSAASLLARMDADGGWYAVPMAVWQQGATRCPACGSFCHQHGGVREFPYASCPECATTVGERTLADEGRVVEVLY